LSRIIARWISDLQNKAVKQGISPEDPRFSDSINALVLEELREMEFLVGGFDFARVITAYYHAYTDGDDDRKSACLRWLRGEYATKTEARNDLKFAEKFYVRSFLIITHCEV
jgi:hypothetical protein